MFADFKFLKSYFKKTESLERRGSWFDLGSAGPWSDYDETRIWKIKKKLEY